jgi:SAM-dependent methyltransferase
MGWDRAAFYDAELRRHNERFRAALQIGRRDRVLDIGCGAGQTTRDAARVAAEGYVLGVDVAAEMLEAARRRSAAEGLRNVVFELGDAQVHPFPSACFDLCISRFGAMFFADPEAAFVNIGRAMRPGGRLVLLVWQGHASNEWATIIQDALAPGTPSATQSAAFSLADRSMVTRILTGAGFAAVDFAEVQEPVFYGPDADSAYDAIVGLYLAKDGVSGDAAADGDTLRRVRALVEAHATADGVLFGSRAWIVTAHKAANPR